MDANHRRYDVDPPATLETSYVICSIPRTGSTMLSWGLWETGLAGYPHEYLHKEKHLMRLSHRWKVSGDHDYLRTLIQKRTSKNGVFGLKAHFHQYRAFLEHGLIDQYLKNSKFIYIKRNSHIEQAVSFAKALQTKKWSFEEISELKPVYHFEEIDRCLKQISHEEDMWEAYFKANHIMPMRIVYEDFIRDYENTLIKALNHIGVTTISSVMVKTPVTKKMADGINAEWCQRYKKDRGLMNHDTNVNLAGEREETASPDLRGRLANPGRIKAKANTTEAQDKRIAPGAVGEGKNLIFLISQPRAGSTMLQKVLGGHSKIATTNEPWIMLHPIFALRHQQVDAPFEPHLANIALEDFVRHFPEKYDLFYQAVRRYALTFYGRCMEKTQKPLFLDKTPRYYMIMPELVKCFPDAKFVVLLRNPMAVLSSMLVSWFKNDPEELAKSRSYNDLVDAPKLLLGGIKLLGTNGYVLNYENLVQDSEREISRLYRWLGIDFDPGMLAYGNNKNADGRLGDQIGVHRYGHPVPNSIDKWRLNFKSPDLNRFAQTVIESIGHETIENMGYSVSQILSQLRSLASGDEDNSSGLKRHLKGNASTGGIGVSSQLTNKRSADRLTSRLVPYEPFDINTYRVSQYKTRIKKAQCSVSIVLPTKGRSEGLKKTLDSLPGAMQDIEYEILLYADRESKQIEGYFDTYPIKTVFYDKDVFKKDEKFSWSKLMNHGFKRASGKWVMFGSDDIVFYPGCFKKACELLHTVDGENIGGVTFFHRNTADTYDGYFDDFGFDTLNGNKPFINFGLINSDAYRKIKGFDEKLRFFWADVDICAQVLQCGYKIIASPCSLVDHHNVQEQRQKDKRIAFFEKDMVYFHSKWQDSKLFPNQSPLEKIRYFLRKKDQQTIIESLNREICRQVVEAEEEKRHIVIDGVIFQLQHGKIHGIKRVWTNLIPELMKQWPNSQITILQRDGYPIPIDGVNSHTVKAYRLDSTERLDEDDEMLMDICHQLKADLFISTYYTRAPGIKNLIIIHDLIPEKFRFDLSQPEWGAKQRAIETADAFICVSHTTQQDFTAFYPQIANRPILVAYNGLDPCFKKPSQDKVTYFRCKMELNEPYVMLVGNRYGYKNGVRMLKTMAQMQKNDRPMVLCVGGENPLSSTELRLQEKIDVKYVGQLSDQDLITAYGGALALMVPSKYEGFGLPVIEAIACGCPVIAEKSPAVEEVGGDAVYFADMSCPDSVRQALQKISEPTFHKEMSAKGRVRAARFNWDKTADDIDQFVTAFMDKPSILLTAIVSTYNAAEFIQGCLEDLVHQTIADRLEIIVVDSASPGDEATIVRGFQRRHANIKYIRTTERESVYQAWNRGIKFALGKYVSNANTDDRHRQDAFEQMVHVLEQDENIALVYADVIKTRTANETFRHCTPTGMFHWYDWDRRTLLEKGCFIGPQPVWRKAVHQEYGYFDDNYAVSADFEFWLRISQTNEFYHISKPLGLYMDRTDSIEHANAQKKRQEDQTIIQRYRVAANDNVLIGRSSGSDQNSKSDCRQAQTDFAQTSSKSLTQNKSTNEEIMQGGDAMHSQETILKAIEHLVDGGHKEAALWVMAKLVVDFPQSAQLHSEMAGLAYEQADMHNALAHFKQAADLEPGNTRYLKDLGDYYYVVEKDAEGALAQYERVLNVDPNNIDILIMAGHLSVSLHRYAQGQQYYQQALNLDPHNSEVRRYLEKMNHPVLDQNSGAMSVDDLYAAAQTKVQDADHETAISLLEQLLAQDDTHALAHNDLGVLYYENGNLQAALTHYEKAAALQPENETLQKNLADFYLAAMGDHEKAMRAYVQVLKLNPRDVEAILSCGQICISLGQGEDARDLINTALETEPWNENAQCMLQQLEQVPEPTVSTGTDLHERAKVKAAEGDLHGAIENLNQYVAGAPDNANAHNDLGVLYFDVGDKNKALAFYEQAVRLDPTDHTYRKNLADFYLIEQGRAEEAMKLYLGVLEENPQDIECLIASGMLCVSLGQREDAKIFYKRVIEIEPWNEIAQNALNASDPDGKRGQTEGVPSAAAG